MSPSQFALGDREERLQFLFGERATFGRIGLLAILQGSDGRTGIIETEAVDDGLMKCHAQNLQVGVGRRGAQIQRRLVAQRGEVALVDVGNVAVGPVAQKNEHLVHRVLVTLMGAGTRFAFLVRHPISEKLSGGGVVDCSPWICS